MQYLMLFKVATQVHLEWSQPWYNQCWPAYSELTTLVRPWSNNVSPTQVIDRKSLRLYNVHGKHQPMIQT